MNAENKEKKPFRWAVLMAFFGVAAMTQMLWLNFAPLESFVESKYAISKDSFGFLMLSFPLVYVLLSMHSGTLIDKKGYRYVIILGSIISALFACLRCFDHSFTMLEIGQYGIAVGQPYVINGISKLVADWFDREETAMATGIGTAGLLIGMALGMGLSPALNDSMGFHNMLVVFAGLSVAFTLIFVWLGRENNKITQESAATSAMSEIKSLIKSRNLNILFIISFLAIGVFNGLMSWTEPLLKPNGLNEEQIGLVGAFLILGGIVGSVLIPTISDKVKARKPFLAVCCLIALAIIYPLCTIKSINMVYVMGCLLGFFFLPGYALMLSMCEETAGFQKAGAATGILMLMGNAGGVVLIILMPVVDAGHTFWTNSIYMMLALMAVTLALVIGPLKDTFLKEKATV
ncbi:MAG: MFS transporter [Bacteroidia bacterium]|nr:MFS transporter [Bacteroidia bacterium]